MGPIIFYVLFSSHHRIQSKTRYCPYLVSLVSFNIEHFHSLSFFVYDINLFKDSGPFLKEQNIPHFVFVGFFLLVRFSLYIPH